MTKEQIHYGSAAPLHINKFISQISLGGVGGGGGNIVKL